MEAFIKICKFEISVTETEFNNFSFSQLRFLALLQN